MNPVNGICDVTKCKIPVVSKEEYEANKTQVNQRIEECFQSVSNGKALVASAITDKGIATGATDTFATMANNISAIETKSFIPIRTEDIYNGDGYSHNVVMLFENSHCNSLTLTMTKDSSCSGRVLVRGSTAKDSGYVTLDDFEMSNGDFVTIDISSYYYIVIMLDRMNGGKGTQKLSYAVR